MSANRQIVDDLMTEHVPMPGMPQVIVTRHFCYLWLKSQGYDSKRKGFGSLDYMAFGRKATIEPLTDEPGAKNVLRGHSGAGIG
jgi:hypothetical protein